MSSRFYPLFNPGNPQLRVFLPNFWMKLIKPEKELPKNVVVFQTSVQMTHHDVKNYLEKIYKVPVVEAKVEIKQGKTRKALNRHYIVKDDDYKIATVTLPRDQTFEFPDILPQHEEEESKALKDANESYKGYARRNLHRPGVPGWYSF